MTKSDGDLNILLNKIENEVQGPSSDNNSVAWKAGARYALQRLREEMIEMAKPE